MQMWIALKTVDKSLLRKRMRLPCSRLFGECIAKGALPFMSDFSAELAANPGMVSNSRPSSGRFSNMGADRKGVVSSFQHSFSFDLPPEVQVHNGVHFRHNALGTVLHQNVVIESGAVIHQGVTLGDGNSYHGKAPDGRHMGKIIVKQGATICAGATILCSDGDLVIGENAIVGASAVVTKSIPDNEIWVGVPARYLKTREPQD